MNVGSYPVGRRSSYQIDNKSQDLLNWLRMGRLAHSMAAQGRAVMSDLIWLSEAQIRRIEPYFCAVARRASG